MLGRFKLMSLCNPLRCLSNGKKYSCLPSFRSMIMIMAEYPKAILCTMVKIIPDEKHDNNQSLIKHRLKQKNVCVFTWCHEICESEVVCSIDGFIKDEGNGGNLFRHAARSYLERKNVDL